METHIGVAAGEAEGLSEAAVGAGETLALTLPDKMLWALPHHLVGEEGGAEGDEEDPAGAVVDGHQIRQGH